jgi:hypothetical protein
MRSGRITLAALAVAVVATLASCASTPAIVVNQPAPDGQATPTQAGPSSVAAARNGLLAAQFVLVNGVTSATVRVADTGDDLFRIASPAGASVRPVPVVSGDRVELQIASTGLQGASAVVIALSSAVVWNVRLSGGASESLVDFRGGKLAGLAFTAGSARIETYLPTPTGTATLQMTGGSSDFVVHAPASVPVQARLDGGAGSLTLDGAASTGLSGGSVRSSDGFDTASNRYIIQCTAGVSALTVNHGS